MGYLSRSSRRTRPLDSGTAEMKRRPPSKGTVPKPQLKPWYGVVMVFLIIGLGLITFLFYQANKKLYADNHKLALIILKPAVPQKLYVFGCSGPSAGVLVYSNGSSYLIKTKAELMKLSPRIPKDIEIIPYQPPECRPSGT